MEAISQGNLAALSAVFLMAALTEVGIPFPFVIDGILFFTGYRIGLFSVSLLLVVTTLFLGRLFGSSIIYWVFRFVDRPFSRWLRSRFPSVQERMDTLRYKLGTRAPLAIAMARLTPGLLTPASVCAGGIRIPFGYFAAGIAISSIIADGILVMLGFATSHGLRRLGLTPSVWMIIIGLIAFLVLVWLVRRHVFTPKKPRPPGPAAAS